MAVTAIEVVYRGIFQKSLSRLDSGKRGTMSVKKGDVVFYGKYSGTEVEVNDQTYVLVRENDILAIVD